MCNNILGFKMGKRKTQTGKKIFIIYVTKKNNYSIYLNNSVKLIKESSSIYKSAKKLTTSFEKSEMAIKNIENFLNSLVSIQIITIMK